MNKITVLKESLLKTLKADEQELLLELIDNQITATGISAEENFILGFRLAARIMREIYDDEDGEFLEII